LAVEIDLPHGQLGRAHGCLQLLLHVREFLVVVHTLGYVLDAARAVERATARCSPYWMRVIAVTTAMPAPSATLVPDWDENLMCAKASYFFAKASIPKVAGLSTACVW